MVRAHRRYFLARKRRMEYGREKPYLASLGYEPQAGEETGQFKFPTYKTEKLGKLNFHKERERKEPKERERKNTPSRGSPPQTPSSLGHTSTVWSGTFPLWRRASALQRESSLPTHQNVISTYGS